MVEVGFDGLGDDTMMPVLAGHSRVDTGIPFIHKIPTIRFGYGGVTSSSGPNFNFEQRF